MMSIKLRKNDFGWSTTCRKQIFPQFHSPRQHYIQESHYIDNKCILQVIFYPYAPELPCDIEQPSKLYSFSQQNREAKLYGEWYAKQL